MRHTLIGAILIAFAAHGALAAGPASAPAAMATPMGSPHAASSAMPGHPGGGTSAMQRNRPQPVAHYVDINSADRKELMTLPGIGAAEADRIVANRPYLTKTELVTKQVLQTGPYLSIKNQIVAMQKFQTKPKAKG